MIDNDDDHTICALSKYIEAKALGPFLEDLHNTGVLSVDKVRNREDIKDIFFVVENSTEEDLYFKSSRNFKNVLLLF